ncbi:ferritin-like domain-containing protein [Streptacidiphilus sp. P02-A3a]|uniref:ferritin-like domain-containing protein n=1 Tax=Streptacidiphilus sp. P02-A3a TaxID=2704468 RepID=UPI0015F7CFD7|nr:ferritin-like domain-containing protein [Streptacidiphilus sp. P02-A3a]QMU73825.1 ferritin-like domain-containing protein [Streptacidiphilus sp. P02-A3a]QMU74127.1 ferritin-like domain-containing protein [Streptacidiphilus sp. P02-A3a]
MGEENLDTRLLAELTEQSQDLNSDAVRITRDALSEFGQEREPARRWWQRGGAVAAVAGGAALWGVSRAAAASGGDVMALQTAASIENLAVSVYTTAAGLPFIKDGNKTVAAFIAKTTSQHQAHAQAFNAAVTQAGGKAQTGPDPKYAAVVKQMLPSIKGPGDVVSLAITLEDVAAQTYTSYTSKVSDAALRKLFASVAPVEAQHRATLLAVQALLAGGDASLIAIPTDLAKLPAAAGSVGFPDAFYSTKNASPISEGAVQ